VINFWNKLFPSVKYSKVNKLFPFVDKLLWYFKNISQRKYKVSLHQDL
jgi:hypothetical protein